jgi:membrane protease YdiL (CAAX protease family)
LNAELPPLRFKPVVILVSTAVFLAILFRFGRLPFYWQSIAPYFEGDPDVALYGYYWVAGSSVLTRTVLPLLVIVIVLRERPRDYGYRLRGTGGLGRIYLLLLGVMLPLLYLGSTNQAFLDRYPLYDGAAMSLEHFLLYEASYFFVFLSGESFWRGYMVFGLESTFGYYAIGIMAIPYVLIHWGKPVPEVFGALVAALVLGYLAIKHRSFWLGVALHFTIALTMDVLALWQKGEI